MQYSSAVALDLVLSIALAFCALAGAWAAVPRDSRSPRRSATLHAVSGTAVALLVGKGLLGLAIGEHGWVFAQRRLVVELPVVAVPLLTAAVVTLYSSVHRRADSTVARRLRLTAGLWSWAAMTAVGVAAEAALLRRPLVLAAVPVVAGLAALLVASARLRSTPALARWRDPLKGAAVVVLALVVVAAGAQSRLPGSYDLGALATMDAGGGPGGSHHAVPVSNESPDTRSVTELTGPQTGVPDVSIELEASEQRMEGRDALAFNEQVPGPTVTATRGDLIEVVLANKDVDDGVSIHWHGYDVPNAEDGVAGVTQDAVKPGGKHVYRFLAEQVGTFWYHSHQVSSEQVERGLYGALVVTDPQTQAPPGEDLTVLDHGWRGPGGFLLGDKDVDEPGRLERREVPPGTPVLLRLINSHKTFNRYALVGAPFTVVAVDGTDLDGPTALDEQAIELAAGGRYDLSFTMPDGPVTLLGLGDGYRLVLGTGEPAGRAAAGGWPVLDLTGYGSPPADADGDRTGPYDRDFTMDIDRRLGWLDGRPGYLWSVNGKTYPDMPMFMVAEGDQVRVTIVNRTLDDHPIHLHGHHMRVLERNGRPVTGGRWSSDTLNAAPGERYVVAFRADNPGIWMDHCHNLDHAAQGFVMHVGYEGVTTPFRIGRDSGNQPE